MFENNVPYTLTVIDTGIDTLIPYARNARTHSKKHLRQIADGGQPSAYL